MITFKEIDMVGFKSFADHTQISFDGGITGIVGPNGCGKSNVSDAIRWVLGEQSSKALRGKSMQDVIFAGTEKRKKLSYCEVSLVFDNTNKWFNIDYDEVVITRKLYRSGESEYQINRKPCRLKDIRDILYDSGIGKDGYSIIGQGRVEEIIQSKPEERRSIFEEAAGIAKYKARKVETENRLERVRENLSRATDILTEVERRLGPLKRQSEDAKKYLEYRDELKALEINAYIYQYDHASSIKKEINEKLTGYKDNLNVLTNSLETEQAKYDKSLNEINALDRKANEIHEEVLRHTIALEKRQSDSRLLNEQTKHLREQIERLTNELNQYELDLKQRTVLVENASLQKKDEEEALRKLREERDVNTENYLKLVDEISLTEGAKEESQKNIIDNLSKLTDIKANLSGYKAKRETLMENISQDKLKLEEANKEKLNSELEFRDLDKIVSDLYSSKQAKEKNIVSLQEKMQTLTSSIENLNSDIYSLKTAISNDTNRKNILVNLQADFEGYQFAVKRLLQEGKKNPVLSKAIKGVVGNIISVDEKFQTAIEIALGGSIQNVVTQNEEDTKILINYLKEAKVGRATFLPISAVKPRFLSSSDRKFLSSKGVYGVANELVKTDSMYRPVIDSLLGNTVVCENLDDAVAIAKSSGYAFRIVTLEGDILSPQGSMSGGSKKSNDSSLLNKDKEIKNLTKNIDDNTKELEILTEEYNSQIQSMNKIKELLANERETLTSINSDYYTNNTKLEGLKSLIETKSEQIFSITSQIKVAEDMVESLSSQIDSIDQVEQDYHTAQAQAGAERETKNSVYVELKKRKEDYIEMMTSSRVDIASKEEKIRALSKDIENNSVEIEGLNANIERVKRELESEQKVFDEVVAMNISKEDKEETASLEAKLQELNGKISQFDDFKASLMRELKDLDEKKSNITNDISRMNNKIYQEEAKLQKVDIDIENMQERIYEEYEMTYNDCLPFKAQDENYDIKENLSRISRLKGQITSLGYVNVNAIEEYKSEGARFEEMNGQIEDLKRAEEDAVKIIKDLSMEMLDKFNTEFVKIQENFTKVFKELFGGGNARLELLPSDDPLTAGVEIIAQPPGKVLSNITLLSGGEKTMTAIAILFAILKLKPMPFCFLDEIEAALDDANIDRYAKYLKRFSDDTQFIVITHRKPTMEVVDTLYGVTMEEKGVSKIVSVKLAEAVKQVNAN
ncbi:MAG: chromosome segregation protein SMC [Clostridiales bacterium]|nr:chromosome segregation protein SMC [Clostridiales bacterium]